MRIIVILFIIVILASLASALYYMVKDRGTNGTLIGARASTSYNKRLNRTVA